MGWLRAEYYNTGNLTQISVSDHSFPEQEKAMGELYLAPM